jgi:hypothetical protein
MRSKSLASPSPPDKKRKLSQSSEEDDDGTSVQAVQFDSSVTLKPEPRSPLTPIVEQPNAKAGTNQATQTIPNIEVGKSINNLIGTVQSLQKEVEKLREDSSKDRMLQKEESDRLWKLIFNLVEKNNGTMAWTT